jgi:LmbE family N-acetylglucosaminyl deacetylase
MKKNVFVLALLMIGLLGTAQTPKAWSSSEILQQLKKLEVFGSVLYIAAHPDDENTRLLAYLANERKFRTGYLSITRGDGGQNLIGDEQGVELGLIRTQELLAARRIDGAEQFFTRAYDFGYSKSPEEALRIWDHQKVLSDVVWVIRNFKPDVIITRFPTTGEGGHGHHTASAILAGEAFDIAADPTKFPEQLKNGVTVWQAKRLLWNSFNFGGNNTTREDQLKIDVGMYNPVLGKSYGEMAAESRSQHKSQGFGVPAQRGESFEYFATIKGDKPSTDIFDGIDVSSARSGQPALTKQAYDISSGFKMESPSASLTALIKFKKLLETSKDEYWKKQKLKELNNLVEASSGIFMEATTNTPYAVVGDSLKINLTINNRSGIAAKNYDVHFPGTYITLKEEAKNRNVVWPFAIYINESADLSQPYWLKEGMPNGSFIVSDQSLIGKPWNEERWPQFSVEIEGEKFFFEKPIRYKFTDPVKGEIYQPVTVVPNLTIHVQPELSLINKNNESSNLVDAKYRLFTDGVRLDNTMPNYAVLKDVKSGAVHTIKTRSGINLNSNGRQLYDIREISYDHIPAIRYFKPLVQKTIQADFKIAGKNIGYITGAGDKVPQALTQMGYQVKLLGEEDITAANLKQFDAIITGIRAYNTNLWLSNASTVLNNYVKEGGVLLVQYNTNNNAGPLRQKIGPFPFTLGRSRITDENAPVNFLIPNHPVLNYPNKITQKDFEGWIQERSIYHAENADSNYQKILSMKDPGEKEHDGSLIVADYGKGRFIYTGLVFFRELPAGVPGAYRLLANLIAPAAPQNVLPKSK